MKEITTNSQKSTTSKKAFKMCKHFQMIHKKELQ